MIAAANTIDDALAWFTEHHTGCLFYTREDGQKRPCFSFQEVLAFHHEKRQPTMQIDNSIAYFRGLTNSFNEAVAEPFDMSDLDAMNDYYQKLHSLYITLANKEPRAEAYFLQKVQTEIEKGLPSDVLPVIKNSSTMQMNYFAGLFATEYSTWRQMKSALEAGKEIMYNLRTQISTIRERSKMEGAPQLAQK